MLSSMYSLSRHIMFFRRLNSSLPRFFVLQSLLLVCLAFAFFAAHRRIVIDVISRDLLNRLPIFITLNVSFMSKTDSINHGL